MVASARAATGCSARSRAGRASEMAASKRCAAAASLSDMNCSAASVCATWTCTDLSATARVTSALTACPAAKAVGARTPAHALDASSSACAAVALVSATDVGVPRNDPAAATATSNSGSVAAVSNFGITSVAACWPSERERSSMRTAVHRDSINPSVPLATSISLFTPGCTTCCCCRKHSTNGWATAATVSGAMKPSMRSACCDAGACARCCCGCSHVSRGVRTAAAARNDLHESSHTSTAATSCPGGGGDGQYCSGCDCCVGADEGDGCGSPPASRLDDTWAARAAGSCIICTSTSAPRTPHSRRRRLCSASRRAACNDGQRSSRPSSLNVRSMPGGRSSLVWGPSLAVHVACACACAWGPSLAVYVAGMSSPRSLSQRRAVTVDLSSSAFSRSAPTRIALL